MQNLLPMNMVCHPVLQHPGLAGSVGVRGQLQCLWVSHDPIAIFEQSLAKAVGRAG